MPVKVWLQTSRGAAQNSLASEAIRFGSETAADQLLFFSVGLRGIAGKISTQSQVVDENNAVVLIDVSLCDRHFAADAECAAGHFQSRWRLLAFVFVEVNPTLHPAHGFFIESPRNNVAGA